MIFKDPYILRFEPEFGWDVRESDTAFEPISDEEAYEILDLDRIESYLPRDLLIEEIEALGADPQLRDWEMEKLRLMRPSPPLTVEDLLDDLGFEDEIEADYGPLNLAALIRKVIDKIQQNFEFYVEGEVECDLEFTLLFMHLHVRLIRRDNAKAIWSDYWALSDIGEVRGERIVVFPKIVGSLVLESINRNKQILIIEKEG